MPRRRARALQLDVTHSPFDAALALAIVSVSASDNTRRAYRRDVDVWLAFCRERDVDPASPIDGAVEAWMAWLRRRDESSKTRGRRIAALSSVYRELRRKRVVTANPFSVDEGPRRERPTAEEPTPKAAADVVRRAIAACGDDLVGVRDAAILRVLWSTGMRAMSLLSMTFERLERERDGFLAHVEWKGGGELRPMPITGKAAAALERWLAMLKDGGFTKGAIWRCIDGARLSERELAYAFDEISARAGVDVDLSPHMFRVSFGTYNRAPLEAKQAALGHADPKTTLSYDRSSSRARQAFDQMPDPEDVDD